MVRSLTIMKQIPEHESDIFKDEIKTDMAFIEVQRDTIGKSGACPTWGYVYNNVNGKMKFKAIALHKEYDYDYPMSAYGEKTWSILGREVLGESVRVPYIELVEQSPGQAEILSYRVMDNDTEDMIHIKDTLFKKFQREEIKDKKEIFTLDEILECIRLQIEDEENYKQVEKDIIQVLLLDAVTNNGDRHVLNWALIRGEKTNRYNLAVFDHASSFVDMFDDRSYHLGNGWTGTYITVGADKGKRNIGSDGKTIIEYIAKQYPEYFEEFCDRFDAKLPQVLEQIEQENMKIDFKRLSNKLGERRVLLRRLRDRGNFEYGE